MRPLRGLLVIAFGVVSGFGVAKASAGPPGHNPDLDHKCGDGFAWSRKVVACVQSECPAGANRTYTLGCNCGEAWGKPFRTCMDPKRPGFATHCVAKGASCDKAGPKPSKPPRVKPGPKPKPKPKPKPRAKPKPKPPRIAPLDERPSCLDPYRSSHDERRGVCACPSGSKPDALRGECIYDTSRRDVDTFETCSADNLQQGNEVYDDIRRRAVSLDSSTAVSLRRAEKALATGTAPAALRTIAVPERKVTGGEECWSPPRKTREPLPAPVREHVARVVDRMDRNETPQWILDIDDDYATLTNVGRAVMKHAPASIKSGDECTRAKYVYATALPILHERFGLWQMDGSTFGGGCRVFVSHRGALRIGNAGLGAVDTATGFVAESFGKDGTQWMRTPQDILLASKQGTCGEWAYGLREVMQAAGLRASVITAYRPWVGALVNHAGTAIECVRNGKVERRVCDAWYLGHDNQSERYFAHGNFDGAADSIHNCRPMDDWKRAQTRNGKRARAFFNPDLEGDHGDWTSKRELSLPELQRSVDVTVVKAAKYGWNTKRLLKQLGPRMMSLIEAEKKQTLATMLERSLAKAPDEVTRKAMRAWIGELRR